MDTLTSDTGGGKKGASTGRRLIAPRVQPLSRWQRDAKEGVEPGLPLLREVLGRYMKHGLVVPSPPAVLRESTSLPMAFEEDPSPAATNQPA